MKYNKQLIKEEISRMIKNEGIMDGPAALWGGIKGAGQNLVGNYRTNAVKTRMDRVGDRIAKDFDKNAKTAYETGEKMSQSSNQSVKATGENIINQIDAATQNINQATQHIHQAFPSSVGQVMEPGTKDKPQPQINLVQPQQVQQAQQQASAQAQQNVPKSPVAQPQAQPPSPNAAPAQKPAQAKNRPPSMNPGQPQPTKAAKVVNAGSAGLNIGKNLVNQPASKTAANAAGAVAGKVAGKTKQNQVQSNLQKMITSMPPEDQEMIMDFIESRPDAKKALARIKDDPKRLKEIFDSILSISKAKKQQEQEQEDEQPQQNESLNFKLADIFS